MAPLDVTYSPQLRISLGYYAADEQVEIVGGKAFL
jgi:hypothetical protein